VQILDDKTVYIPNFFLFVGNEKGYKFKVNIRGPSHEKILYTKGKSSPDGFLNLHTEKEYPLDKPDYDKSERMGIYKANQKGSAHNSKDSIKRNCCVLGVSLKKSPLVSRTDS
jgi:hypothetical protein